MLQAESALKTAQDEQTRKAQAMAEETLASELKLRDEAHAADLLRKDAEMGGRLAETERGGVATLQRVEEQLQAKVCFVVELLSFGSVFTLSAADHRTG